MCNTSERSRNRRARVANRRTLIYKTWRLRSHFNVHLRRRGARAFTAMRIFTRIPRATRSALEEYARNARRVHVFLSADPRAGVAFSRPRPVLTASTAAARAGGAVRRHHSASTTSTVRRHHPWINHHHLPARGVRRKPRAALKPALVRHPHHHHRPIASASSPTIRSARRVLAVHRASRGGGFQRIQTHPAQGRVPADDGSKIHDRAHPAPLALSTVRGPSAVFVHLPRREPSRSRRRALSLLKPSTASSSASLAAASSSLAAAVSVRPASPFVSRSRVRRQRRVRDAARRLSRARVVVVHRHRLVERADVDAVRVAVRRHVCRLLGANRISVARVRFSRRRASRGRRDEARRGDGDARGRSRSIARASRARIRVDARRATTSDDERRPERLSSATR